MLQTHRHRPLRDQLRSGVALGQHVTPYVLSSIFAITVGLLLNFPVATRFALASVVGVVAAIFAVRAPKVVLYILPVWLVLLGTLRRLTTGLVGTGARIDPLLAVEPLVLAMLGVLAIKSGALRRRTRLTNAVFILVGILMISSLNPLQGSISAGVTGAVLVVAPMLAFLIGRSLLDDRTFLRLVLIVACLAIPASAYGLYQVFGHFPSWDQRWLDQNTTFLALNVGGKIRPFGSFASGQEFGEYAAMGLVIFLASFGRPLRRLWILAPLGLLAAAVWYESSRTIVVLVALSVTMLGATRIGWPIRRSLLAALLVVAILPWVAGHTLPTSFRGSAATLQRHQASGLADPFGNQSTLPTHLSLVGNGLKQAITNPLGRGVGSVTGAAQKFGTSSASTEFDIGNIAVAAGVLGVLAYLSVVIAGFSRVSRLVLQRQDAPAMAALAVLALTSMQWLNGGLYAIGWLPWLILGWVDSQPTSTPQRLAGRLQPNTYASRTT